MPGKFQTSKLIEEARADQEKKATLNISINTTPQGMLERGLICISEFRYEDACDELRILLGKEPNNTEAMDLMAQALLEIGDDKKAYELLVTSTQLEPMKNSEKWMYLAQLHSGIEAAQCFEKGINVLMQQLEQLNATQIQNNEHKAQLSKQRHAISRQISNAYCSIVEIFTTDLCDEPDAENQCEKFTEMALQASNDNPEAYYVLANLRYLQQRITDAEKALEQSVKLLSVDDDDAIQPSVDIQTSVAKLCMELEHFDVACQLLENILQIDDSFVELWYLLGVCYMKLEDIGSSVEALEQAEAILEKLPSGGDLGLAESVQHFLNSLREQSCMME